MNRLCILPLGLGLALAGSLPAQIVITEIMYHPADQGRIQVNNAEWIEIYNSSDKPVDIENWRLFDERYLLTGNELDAADRFRDEDFSGGINSSGDKISILVPGEVAVIVPSSRGAEQFRFSWDLSPSVKIVSPNWNNFENQDVPFGTYDPKENTVNSAEAQPSWIHLVNAANEIIDIVDYENGFNENQGRDWPNTGNIGYKNANGGSIFLDSDVVTSENPAAGNDQGRNWRLSVAGNFGAWKQKDIGSEFNLIYSSQTQGSPGFIAGVDTPIPEPNSMGILIGLALFGGLVIGRRR